MKCILRASFEQEEEEEEGVERMRVWRLYPDWIQQKLCLWGWSFHQTHNKTYIDGMVSIKQSSRTRPLKWDTYCSRRFFHDYDNNQSIWDEDWKILMMTKYTHLMNCWQWLLISTSLITITTTNYGSKRALTIDDSTISYFYDDMYHLKKLFHRTIFDDTEP